MLTSEQPQMHLTNEITPNKPPPYRGYPSNYSFNKNINNGSISSNNTSSKFQLLSESSKTWETFARDDILTFLELEVHPLMLVHLIQEMFHITLHLLRELISETLISVRKALKLPEKEETIKNIEHRVKPLFKENLDEIFCSKTENEKFRMKFDNEFTSFFINKLNLKYCEEDKSAEFNNMLKDKGFNICLSNVKLILLFCEFNEEQLYINDIEHDFNERQIEIINLKSIDNNNNTNYRKHYLIFNETQNCKKVIPIITSPFIKKNNKAFNHDKFKSIAISITDSQENNMNIYPLNPNKDNILTTSSYMNGNPIETCENTNYKKCSFEKDKDKKYHCDTESHSKNKHKFCNTRVSLNKYAHRLFFNSIKKDDHVQMKFNNKNHYKAIPHMKHNNQHNDNNNNHHNNINYLSATKISNRNKCLLSRFSSIESNSYRNRSKPEQNNKQNDNKNHSDIYNDNIRLSSQQKNRTRSSYHKGNVYEKSNTLPRNSNIFIDKELFFIKTLQIPKTKRDNVPVSDTRSISQELSGQCKHNKKDIKHKINKDIIRNRKGEVSETYNEISSESNNKKNSKGSRDRNLCCYVGKTNLSKRITKLTKHKHK